MLSLIPYFTSNSFMFCLELNFSFTNFLYCSFIFEVTWLSYQMMQSFVYHDQSQLFTGLINARSSPGILQLQLHHPNFSSSSKCQNPKSPWTKKIIQITRSINLNYFSAKTMGFSNCLRVLSKYKLNACLAKLVEPTTL